MLPFFMSPAGALLLRPPLGRLRPSRSATYALATGAEAVRVGSTAGLGDPRGVGDVPGAARSHGVGFAAGLLQYLRKPDWGEPERIEARAAGGVAAGAGR